MVPVPLRRRLDASTFALRAPTLVRRLHISNHLRSLGIYFDSIIMVDPLHFPSLSSLHSFLSLPPDNSYVRMRRLVLLEHVSNLFRAIPFMTIDDDYPIFLIVPELLDFDKERNHEQSATFLSQLFFKDRKMDYATYLNRHG